MTDMLFVHEAGAGGTPLVLLHGFGGTHAIWHELQRALSDAHRVLAYDLPGHGRSFAFPEAGPPKVAVRALLADLAGRGIDRFHLAGHSMGGAISALMALAAPDRVASLTLVAPGGFGPEIDGPLLRRFAAAREASEISACLAAMSGPDHVVAAASVESCLEARALPEQTERLVAIGASITRDERQGVIPRDSLAGLDMPVKVIWGSEDAVLPFAQTQGLPTRFALHACAGAGHMLVEERPRDVSFLLRQNMR